MSENQEIFYRYRDYMTAPGVNESGDSVGEGSVHLACDKYIVERRTEKSVFLRPWYGGLKGTDDEVKCCRLNAKKVFAAPTKKEALYHFIKRKERQAVIYQSRLSTAKEAKRLAEQILKNHDYH